jgi:hypothetical protein
MGITVDYLFDNHFSKAIGISPPLTNKISCLAKWLFTSATFELATIKF